MEQNTFRLSASRMRQGDRNDEWSRIPFACLRRGCDREAGMTNVKLPFRDLCFGLSVFRSAIRNPTFHVPLLSLRSCLLVSKFAIRNRCLNHSTTQLFSLFVLTNQPFDWLLLLSSTGFSLTPYSVILNPVLLRITVSRRWTVFN